MAIQADGEPAVFVNGTGETLWMTYADKANAAGGETVEFTREQVEFLMKEFGEALEFWDKKRKKAE